jgi:hypothetical protein
MAAGICGQSDCSDDHPGDIAPVAAIDATVFRRLFVEDNHGYTFQKMGLAPRGLLRRSVDANTARLQHCTQNVRRFRKFVHDEDAPSVLHVAILPWIAARSSGVGAENTGKGATCQNQYSRLR